MDGHHSAAGTKENWAQGRGNWQPILGCSHSLKKELKDWITQLTLVIPTSEGKSDMPAKGHGGFGFRQNCLVSRVDRKEACTEKCRDSDSSPSLGMSTPIRTWILEKDSGDNDHRIWLFKSVSRRDKPNLAMWAWWETVFASGNTERKGQNKNPITISYRATERVPQPHGTLFHRGWGVWEILSY